MKPSQIANELLAIAENRGVEQFDAGFLPQDCARGLLSPKRLGQHLNDPLVRYPQVRIALGGRAVPARDYITRRRIGTQWVDDGIDARKVGDWLVRGATITLDSLEFLSGPVDAICHVLTRALGLPATATAYITPPGRQGLSPHTDEEDVFVVQTFGTKSWIVDSDQRQAVATASGFPFNGRMQLVTPRVLSVGDFFFMPAGTPHVATAQNDLSIHITFSVERPRVRNLLDPLVQSVLSDTPAFQRLQGWHGETNPGVGALIQLLESRLLEDRPAVPEPAVGLPFDSWNALDSEALSIRLKTDVAITETAEGFALEFPTFTMKVGRTAGGVLKQLTKCERVLIDSKDDEFAAIIFHLIGRDVIEATSAALR